MSRINKIIELKAEIDGIEFDDIAVEIMSLVESPAIGVNWAAFAAHQFVDAIPGESKDNYLGRCIPQLIKEGYDQDQAAAICYGSYSEDEFEINVDGLPDFVDELGIKPKIVKEIEFHNAVLEFASRPDVGEVLDIATTTFVSLAQQEFETVTEFLRGIDALDILSQLSGSGSQQVPEPSYRYTGPGAQRNFCRALMALNKIYTRAEINMMDGVNFGFGPNGSNFYSIFDYKGGVNCQHYWEQLRVFRTAGGRNIVISEGPAAGLAGESCNSSEPSPTGYVRNNARLSSEWTFAADEDQQIITGPAMRPWQMIPRKDEKTGEIFHVYFSADTVKKLSEKFLREHKQHLTDINHSMNPNEENTLIESWIVEDPEMDKSVALGFKPAKGDWYTSYKINNPETWKQIKEGKLNGFSIAGQFIERTTNKNG